MRVQNLTGKATPMLEQYGLVNMQLALAGNLLLPGAATDISDAEAATAHVQHWLQVGALGPASSDDYIPPPPKPKAPAPESKKG